MMSRSVVVTGASSGIGETIAHHLSSQGWSVVVIGRNPERTEAVAAALPGPARACVGDIAVESTSRSALGLALEMAPLGGWVNSAGLTIRNGMEHFNPVAAHSMVDSNMWGTLHGTHTAVNHWLELDQPGALVNMSSVHGSRAYPEHTVYEMTKAAIEALSRSIAITYGGRGIRANTVAPGAIRTPALDQSFAGAPDPAAAEGNLASRTPMKRIGESLEVATVVRFLLSDDASYVNGVTIPIDGGWNATLGLDPADAAARRPDGGRR